MNCAACHTRQIQVDKTSYRIDGGPAISDFQGFMSGIDDAVAHLLADPAAFKTFAADVLGGNPTDPEIQKLRTDVQAWFTPYDLLVKKALPADNPWGPARLDAVGMIFNRLTGIDIGAAPDYSIPGNIMKAEAPVRYPFLWNAPIQDYTQWPGFAPNGDTALGLVRNTGEVFGVFALFHPRKPVGKAPLNIDYVSVNSSNTLGLLSLEYLIGRQGAPQYQWPVDAALAKRGGEIFNWPTAQGGCGECHGQRKGQFRSLLHETWATTPLQDVGTDNREWVMLGVPGDPAWPGWQVDTGVLNGAKIPLLAPAGLKATDSAFSTLGVAVGGTILERAIEFGGGARLKAKLADVAQNPDLATNGLPALSGAEKTEVETAFARPRQQAALLTTGPYNGPFKYEARVLYGVWAAAPYLHNGSVPTLADLLKPASDRPKSFQVGPSYDPVNVGLAPVQPAFNYTLHTTGCDQRTSGESNCGHEFGTTTLTPDQKKALLEYLKTL